MSPLIQMVHEAWPDTPYPGDHILTNCWCDECSEALQGLRGKSWKQLRRANIEGVFPSRDRAFLYYLPALLLFSLDDEDDAWMTGLIMGGFFMISHTPPAQGEPEEQARIEANATRLSKKQRRVLIDYFAWVANQGWQCPLFVDAATACVEQGNVRPVRYDAYRAWITRRERELRLARAKEKRSE